MIFLVMFAALYLVPLFAVFALDRQAVRVKIETSKYSSDTFKFHTNLTGPPRYGNDYNQVGALWACALIPILNIGTVVYQCGDLVSKNKLYSEARKLKSEVSGESLSGEVDAIAAARQKFREQRIKQLEDKAYR